MGRRTRDGRAGRRQYGARLSDRIVSYAAIVVAVTAVVVAVYEARITREHQRVSVWPYVTQYNTMPAGGPYARHLSNEGVGPALVESFQVRLDGQPVRTWSEAFAPLLEGGGAGELREGLRGSTYASVRRGTVILPGNTVRLLEIPPGPAATGVFAEMQRGRVTTHACYCSLYGECWRADSEAMQPEQVRACAAEPEAEFSQ